MTRQCPSCGGTDLEPWLITAGSASEGGVDPVAFRPSATGFGRPVSPLVRCRACGHGTVAELPPPPAVLDAYRHAVDEISLAEEAGQVATADRDLALVERTIRPGRLLDVGCWTGSLLVAATRRGWTATGLEPSTWARRRALERGMEVEGTPLDSAELPPHRFRLITLTDVLEHLAEPSDALDACRAAVEPGGGLFVTVPDAGSVTARALRERWWSVLPMHLQYFSAGSLALLLDRHGFTTRWVRSHAKVFSARYYLERLAAFVPPAAPVVRPLARARFTERLVAPDLHDRLALLAVAR